MAALTARSRKPGKSAESGVTAALAQAQAALAGIPDKIELARHDHDSHVRVTLVAAYACFPADSEARSQMRWTIDKDYALSVIWQGIKELGYHPALVQEFVDKFPVRTADGQRATSTGFRYYIGFKLPAGSERAH